MIEQLQHAPQLLERTKRASTVLASSQVELPWATRPVALATGALPARVDAQVELALLHVAELVRDSPLAERRESRQKLPAALRRSRPPTVYRSSGRWLSGDDQDPAAARGAR